MNVRPLVLAIALAVGLATVVRWAAPGASAVPPLLSVDVLVVGGTPGGVTAAIAAARSGATVLLAEASGRLGGVLTAAWLTTFDMSVGPDGQHLTRGIFLEHYRKLGVSFDRHKAARVMGQAVVREQGLRTLVETPMRGLRTDGRRIAAVYFDDLRWRRSLAVRPAIVIDATDDGDVAAASGAPFVVGRPGHPASDPLMQAATLIFRVGGADWRALTAGINARRRGGADAFGWGVNAKAAWGYPEAAEQYRPSSPHVLIYPLNLALQDDGSVLINALNVTDVDGLDPRSVKIGLARAVAELPGLVAHLRDTVPGFAGAALVDHAPALYIRETRHITGLYTLTADDVLSGRVFQDRIAVASYPIDIHPYYIGWVNPYPGTATEYTISFRALVPQAPENLLIASRALSATSAAHGSARVTPTVMALGQAAGVAAALAVQHGLTPHALAGNPALVRTLQGALIAQEAHLGVEPPPAGAVSAMVAALAEKVVVAEKVPETPPRPLAPRRRVTQTMAGGASSRGGFGRASSCAFSPAVPPEKIRLDFNCR